MRLASPFAQRAFVSALASLVLIGSSIPLLAQDTYTGVGLWTDALNWDLGSVPPDDAEVIINGDCEIAENIGPTNTTNPIRIAIGQGAVGSLRVSGGTLSGTSSTNRGVFVGEGVGGDGTLVIEEGASFRSQGSLMNVRIGDGLGAVGRVTVAGELLNFKFFELINGVLQMMPTGINNKFNSADPSLIGAGGTLAFVIDGASIGALERANDIGLSLTIDPAANLVITLGGSFTLNDSWSLISYSTLNGQFAQGTTFTNQQGYTFDIDYGAGSSDQVTLTLVSDDARPDIRSFVANPPSCSAGAAVELSWDVGNFDNLEIDQGVGEVTAEGGLASMTVNPTQTTTYTLSAMLASATATQSVTVVVDEVPQIVRFTAAPGTIAPGEQSELEWEVNGALSVTISEGIGTVNTHGTCVVMPTETTTYTLTATNATGGITADATVNVDTLSAALINQYLAQAPGQSSGTLLDGVGNSNFDVLNGDLRTLSGSSQTLFTHELVPAIPGSTDGADNGDGFPLGRTFELWVRAAELGGAAEVIFETGSPANGAGLTIDQNSVRVIQSNGGVRTGDVNVPTSQINTADDFIQIVVTLGDVPGNLGLSVRGAAGGSAMATGAGGGTPIDRASLFSWSGSGQEVTEELGGLGDGEIPIGLTTFQGSIALLNVYDRVLSSAEIGEAFARWVDPNAGEVKITAVDYDGTNLSISFDSKPGTLYAIEESVDLGAWSEVVDLMATGGATTVGFVSDFTVKSQLFLRVRELP